MRLEINKDDLDDTIRFVLMRIGIGAVRVGLVCVVIIIGLMLLQYFGYGG